MNSLNISPFGVSYCSSFHVFLNFHLESVIPFSAYLSANLLAKNSFNFCFSENASISLPHSKYISSGYKIMNWQGFFPACQHRIPLSSGSIVLTEKFTVYYCFSFEGVVWFFSGCVQDFLFVFIVGGFALM